MDIFVFVPIAVIISAGILTLTSGADMWTARIHRSSYKRLRFNNLTPVKEILIRAKAEAGKLIYGYPAMRKKEKTHREIYSALSILRNHASSENQSVTTDFLLEFFSQSEGILKNAFSGSLRLLRTGRRQGAAEYFSAAADIPFARDFILLILDWDVIPQNKQKRAIVAFQNAMKEVRTTELTRKNEILSDLIYVPVVAGVLIIFVNFIYVAYFAEQSALLSELFF